MWDLFRREIISEKVDIWVKAILKTLLLIDRLINEVEDTKCLLQMVARLLDVFYIGYAISRVRLMENQSFRF